MNKRLAEQIDAPKRAPRNQTIACTQEEIEHLSKAIIKLDGTSSESEIEGQLIQGDFVEIANHFPRKFVDLLILDPPYNLTKDYNGTVFRKRPAARYITWFKRVVGLIAPMLKSSATIYVCSEWRTSALIFPTLDEEFVVRNRITWEREKGRGAKRNWKNNAEDIWYCTNSDDYRFNVNAVKLKRRILAPYRVNGRPKDWKTEQGGNFRLTHPSNIWTDVTVPFWSMPENTPHPTQKSEKLMAKMILASSMQGDFVFDPFLGSGTSAVVAEKLGRRWCGVDINAQFLCWAKKRIHAAQRDRSIQGYLDGVFWERNSSPRQ